jgi:hypothetical protein
MKKINPIRIFLLISVICMVSCSTNGFMVRKNHQPRIRIEAQEIVETERLSPEKVQADPSIKHPEKIKSIPEENKKVEVKPSFFEKVLITFYPGQKKIISKVFHHPKHQLNPAEVKEGEDRTTGLIINVLALVFAIAAILMVIGVAHGDVWVYFVVGLILAAAGIIMGMIGKGMAWKGLGWLAGAIGIIAVVLLLIFMVLVVVVHTTF